MNNMTEESPLLQKLTVTQVAKELRAFQKSWRFITKPVSNLCPKPTEFSPHPMSFTNILIIPSTLCFLKLWFLHFCFSLLKFCTHFSCIPLCDTRCAISSSFIGSLQHVKSVIYWGPLQANPFNLLLFTLYRFKYASKRPVTKYN